MPGSSIIPAKSSAVLTLLLLSASVCRADGADRASDAAGLEFFERRIRPVLVEHCYRCHSASSDAIKGGLRLDTRAAILRGGDSGTIVVPGQPEASLLLDAVGYSGEFFDMPPDRRLPEHVIADFRRWVQLGAPLPVEAEPDSTPAPVTRPAMNMEQGREFWSFRPAVLQDVPGLSRPDWPLTRIDSFVLAKLDEQGMPPSHAASRETMIRRVCLDLTGVPPSHQQLMDFVQDESADAYARLVDQLLGSPAYGERWARHWLDVARYAEDNPTGESTCQAPRFPWPYRDWIIRALNDDLPYDEFVRRQLAADLMDLPPEEVAATGFLGLSPVYHKEPKLAADVVAVIIADEWDERVDTITRGFLGLTVACARCHDHKFDPIRTDDYYALAGIVASTQLVEWPLADTQTAAAEALTATRDAIVDTELRLSYAKAMQKTADLAGEPSQQYADAARDFQKQLDDLKGRSLFEGPITNAVRDAATWINSDDPDWTVPEYHPGEARDLPVFLRGNPANPGTIVPRRFIEVLTDGSPRPFEHGSGRLELANSMLTDAASLTARVIVNRVWGWHFGTPIVATPSNFGALGERPSHPELLDDLAARFIAQGWSLKWLHREIVLSATYQQTTAWQASLDSHAGSAIDAGPGAAPTHSVPSMVDPDNRLLWRMPRRRLEPEAWRDAVLSVSGRLDRSMTGASQDLNKPDSRRRSVYGSISRQTPADLLLLFDFPDAKQHAEQRQLTTTPLQQLYLLNSPFLRDQSQFLGDRLQSTADTADPDAFIRLAFQTVLLRAPTFTRLTEDSHRGRVGQDIPHNGAVHVGQPEVAAGMPPRQPFMVQSQQMQHGGVQIMHRDSVLHGLESKVVGLSVDHAASNSTAGQPHGESIVVVVPSIAVFGHRCAAEFSTPGHQSVFQQAALFQISEQSGDGLVDLAAEFRNVAVDVSMARMWASRAGSSSRD